MNFNLIAKVGIRDPKNWKQIYKTEVTIQKTDPLSTITQIVDGDITGLSDREVIDKAMMAFYRENFKDKANQEMLKAMEQKIQEVDDKLIEMDLLTSAMQEGVLELLGMQQNQVEEVTKEEK